MGMWNDLAKDIRGRLGSERFVTLHIEDIVAITGTADRAVRKADWWRACAKGDPAYRAFADETIAIDFTEEAGEVSTVSFWRAWLPRPSKP